jgi:tetratricopeptide (TPR) repeat protein
MTSSAQQQAFYRAMSLIESGEPQAAADVCAAALKDAPRDVDLLAMYGSALLGCRKPQLALEPLQQAVKLASGFAIAHEYLGQALSYLGRPEQAIEHLDKALQLSPGSRPALLKLAHAKAAAGFGEEADRLYGQVFASEPRYRVLSEAATHLAAGRLDEAGKLLRAELQANPDDVNTLRLAAKVAGERERWGRAELLLARVLELEPGFHDARLDLVRVLKQQDRIADAVTCAEDTVRRSPGNAHARYMHASMLAVAGEHEQALATYRQAIDLRHNHPAAWVGMGHLLKTLGHQEEAIEAYRTAIRQRPAFGEVYWSLANLKTFRFSDDEVAQMRQQLQRPGLDQDARVHFLFALGKAEEDAGHYAQAFELYDQACAIQRMQVAYDSLETQMINERIRAVLGRELLEQKSGSWQHQPVPIFIVGMPRSGSTLIEQILASHSLVEGTAELPDVGRVIGALNARHASASYPELLQDLSADELRQMGDEYLQRTARHREGLPYFTDKMPNNFPSIGLIHLMLPQAVIIDARRHPLDSCFGSFKQHFAHGQAFSYDLEEIGEYFTEYRAMMAHWQQVLPGKVLEVRYEQLVADLEGQVRRILAHCGLAFEDNCLRFWETERAVRTASSEQVRQPIYTSSLNHWQNFSHQLAPLADQLAGELEAWSAS